MPGDKEESILTNLANLTRIFWEPAPAVGQHWCGDTQRRLSQSGGHAVNRRLHHKERWMSRLQCREPSKTKGFRHDWRNICNTVWSVRFHAAARLVERPRGNQDMPRPNDPGAPKQGTQGRMTQGRICVGSRNSVWFLRCSV